MLTTPDTSIPFPLHSPDITLHVSLDPALPNSPSPDLRSLLLSIPPDILPKAIRSLKTWRLQEPRSALTPTSVLIRRAEEIDCTHPGRRIKWISKEYHAELEREGITDDQHDTYTLPGQHYHHLDSSQLRRGCSARHIPRAPVSNSTPTLKPVPVPTNAISTTAIPTSRTRKPISTPTKAPTSTKTPQPKSRPVANTKMKTKSPPRPAMAVDTENVPPSHVPTQRPAARKSRIPAPAPRVFGLHNA